MPGDVPSPEGLQEDGLEFDAHACMGPDIVDDPGLFLRGAMWTPPHDAPSVHRICFTICECLVALRSAAPADSAALSELLPHHRRIAGILALARAAGYQNLLDIQGDDSGLEVLRRWCPYAVKGVSTMQGELTVPTDEEMTALLRLMRSLLKRSKEAQGLQRVADTVGVLLADGRVVRKPPG